MMKNRNNMENQMNATKPTLPPVKFVITIVIIVVVLILFLFSGNEPFIPSPTETPIDTLTPSFTPTFTLTPTETSTPTITPTPTIAPTTTLGPTGGYLIYDDFDFDTGYFSVKGNQANCPRTYEGGALKIECFGSATKGVDLTLFPTNSQVLSAHGIEMAFYALPQAQGTNQWGKFQISLRFGPSCDNFLRSYYVSIRPNELAFVEEDSNFDSVNPPSPKTSIGTLQPHVIKIELQNGQVNYYLDNVIFRTVSPLENTDPICWMFQSEDNGTKLAEGYRGIVTMWIATKP
jgi:hypothetical protein